MFKFSAPQKPIRCGGGIKYPQSYAFLAKKSVSFYPFSWLAQSVWFHLLGLGTSSCGVYPRHRNRVLTKSHNPIRCDISAVAIYIYICIWFVWTSDIHNLWYTPYPLTNWMHIQVGNSSDLKQWNQVLRILIWDQPQKCSSVFVPHEISAFSH